MFQSLELLPLILTLDIIIGEIKSNTFEEHLTDSGSTNVSVHVSHSLPETKTET